ncbi:phage virion morphogenesis protein, partial [Zymomonas mobilis]|uniref:phage virion morphogenesis protein n=1 Tax=Zymomonas mobilis TaxID=542 RepID=UPI0039EB9CB5
EVSKIMFQKLRMAKYLKKGIDNNDKLEMWTGFIGSAARIARINQFGLTEKWGKRTSHFPSRELLGFTAQDEENILAIIMKALDS